MTTPITYSLRLKNSDSDEYYQVIAELADDWLKQSRLSAGRMVEECASYRQQTGQKERSFEELAFELLALGVLLREHGSQAAGFPEWAARTLNDLIKTQASVRRAEKGSVEDSFIKALRGVVSGLGHSFGYEGRAGDLDALAMARSAGMPMQIQDEPDLGCTLYVRRLVTWLNLHGRSAQARRFAEWQDYIESFAPDKSQEIILRALWLAQEFAIESSVLEPYTDAVDEFLDEVKPQTRWRYDAELVTRTRAEYHLAMLGVEVLSRAHRQRFQAASRHVVIVPNCMRARRQGGPHGEQCQATLTPLGSLCQACTPECRVNQITRLGQKHDFDVYILPEGMRSAGLYALSQTGGIGVLSIACALTAWDSDWDVDDVGVPIQGLLLDYDGCRDHWVDGARESFPVVTDTNLKKLCEIMGC